MKHNQCKYSSNHFTGLELKLQPEAVECTKHLGSFTNETLNTAVPTVAAAQCEAIKKEVSAIVYNNCI